MEEMDKRGYHVDKNWLVASYRGKRCPEMKSVTSFIFNDDCMVYPEHDLNYIEECLVNLRRKGIVIRPGLFYTSAKD